MDKKEAQDLVKVLSNLVTVLKEHNKYIDKIQKKRKRVQQKNNDNATNGKYILHFIFLLIICIFLKYF